LLKETYSESLDVIPTEKAAPHDGDPPHGAPFAKCAVAATQVVDKPIENGAEKHNR